MSDIARGFLSDILANSDDDTPRLVFADWLQENGQEARAEFIRVQVEAAGLPHWDARRIPLTWRDIALLRQHEAAWKKGLPKIKGVEWDGFRRGFPAEVNFKRFTALRDNAAAVWAASPVEVALLPLPKKAEDVAGLPAIAGLRELHLGGVVTSTGPVQALAEAPVLSTLRVLNINGCEFGADGFSRLVASPHLGRLRALQAPFNSLGNGAIDGLVSARPLSSLEELDLQGDGEAGYGYGDDPVIDARGMEALAGWPGLARLRRLTLNGHSPGREGLRALLRSPHAAGLKELRLRSVGLDARAVREFASACEGMRLDVLDVGDNLLRDEGVRALAKADCLRELKVLAVDRCEFGAAGARALAKAPFFGGLRRLEVNSNPLGNDGLRALAGAFPGTLHTLEARDIGLDDEGAAALLAPALDGLSQLDLRDNQLTAAGLKALGTTEHLKGLVALLANDNRFNTRSADAFRKSPLARRLSLLSIGDADPCWII